MALDTSFYSNIRQQELPSYLDSQSKAMSLSQLAMQNRKIAQDQADQEAVKSAFAKNMQQNGDVDRQGVLSDLAKTSPLQALHYKGQFAEMDQKQADAKQKVLADNINQLGMTAQLAMSAKDQASYEDAMKKAASFGLDTSKMPSQFDPGFMRSMAVASLDAKQRLEGMAKTSEIGINESKAPLDRAKTAAEIRHLNAQTAKANNEANSVDPGKIVRGPEAVSLGQAASAIKELDDYQKTLESVNDIRGRGFSSGLAGIQGALQMGENGKRAAAVDATSDKVAQVMGTYLQKGVLDQNTFKRYKDMLPSRYDEPAVAADKIKTVKNLIAQRQNEELKALQQTGYDVSNVPALEGPGHLEVPKGSGGFADKVVNTIAPSANAGSFGVKMQGPDGKVRMIPADQVGEAIAAGGKKVK